MSDYEYPCPHCEAKMTDEQLLICPYCFREGCPICMPLGEDYACPECEKAESEDEE